MEVSHVDVTLKAHEECSNYKLDPVGSLIQDNLYFP